MQADKLKLRENEVVHASTFELAAKVCELADKLELKWCDDCSYLNNIRWATYKAETCYDFYSCGYGMSKLWETQYKTIISATEWLNRHGIFVYGQEVWGSQHSAYQAVNDSQKRIYIAPFNTVALGAEHNFKTGLLFKTTTWGYIVSTFPAWIPEPEKVRFVLGDKETMISAESAKAIKELLG